MTLLPLASGSGVDHSLLGVSGAELPVLATPYPKRSYRGASWVATLFGTDVNHSFLGMLGAKLPLPSHYPV